MAADGSKVVKNTRKPPNAGKGRVKGVPNKSTALLKDAILEAATLAGRGDMVEYLRRQADENPVAFMGLMGKVLPMQIAGDGGGPLTVVIKRFSECQT